MDDRPTWLTVDLLSKLLQLRQPERNLKVTITSAVPESDHYFSRLFRVAVDAGFIKRRFVMKTYPESFAKEFMLSSGMMEREMTMYRRILPMFSEIGIKISPEFYECHLDDVIVMDDLNSLGYAMENRIQRLDFEHCKSALVKLAEFHAGSVIIHSVDSDLIESVGKEVIYIEDNKEMKSFAEKCFNILTSEVENWAEFPKELLEKLKGFKESIWIDVTNSLKLREDKLLVLNHGDFWTNNLLFKHDRDNLTENVKFIDFQVCRWNSPAFDLQRFFVSSVRNLSDIPKLTGVYLQRLNQTFQRNSFDVYLSSEDLEKALDHLNICCILGIACLLPTVLRSEEYTPKRTENVGDPYAMASKDPTFRQVVPEILEYYLRKC